MFTGIIEETGKITAITSNKITINCSKVLKDTQIGDSIAINGVCLTVVHLTNSEFSADISPETLKVTSLSEIKNGDLVNLERALTLSSRLGGHIITGHIDTLGEISNITKNNEFYSLTVKFDTKYKNYVIKKGSIAIDGISLTIADCRDNFVTIAVIPHTFNTTTLKEKHINSKINIEFDILAKYVEKNLISRNNRGVTIDLLAENGFI